MRSLQAIAIIGVGSCAFLVFAWFSTCGVDYHGQDEISSLTTAGWYVLGFPCTAAFGIGYGALFALIGRRARFWLAWLSLLLVSVPLVLLTVRHSLPSQRLASIIGPEASKVATIVSFHEQDSYNDGTWTDGVITGPENLLDLIVRQRNLKAQVELPLTNFQSTFRDEQIPEIGDVYSNKRAMFYRHPSTKRIYFVIPYRPARP